MKKEDKVKLLQQYEAGVISLPQLIEATNPKKHAVIIIYSENKKWFKLDHKGPWVNKEEMELGKKGCEIAFELPYNNRDDSPPPNN